jgi:hypothetical protein
MALAEAGSKPCEKKKGKRCKKEINKLLNYISREGMLN